jgi:ankyrin repeat protein
VVVIAARAGSVDILSLLLKDGEADANATNDAGDTALMVAAARASRTDVVRPMLQVQVQVCVKLSLLSLASRISE